MPVSRTLPRLAGLVLGVTLLCGGLGLLAAMAVGNRYRAVASVVLLPPRPDAADQDPQRRADTLGLIAQSPAFSQRVADAAGVAGATVEDDLAASVDPSSNVLRLRTTATSAALALKIADAAATGYEPFVQTVTGEDRAASVLDRPTRATEIGPQAVRGVAAGLTFGLAAGVLLAALLLRRRRRPLAEVPPRGSTNAAVSAEMTRVARELERIHGADDRRRLVVVTSAGGDVEAARLAAHLAVELETGTPPSMMVLRDKRSPSPAQTEILDALDVEVRDVPVAATTTLPDPGGPPWQVALSPLVSGSSTLELIWAGAHEVLLALIVEDTRAERESLALVAGVTQVVVFRR